MLSQYFYNLLIIFSRRMLQAPGYVGFTSKRGLTLSFQKRICTVFVVINPVFYAF
jgi:hypothetical protein